ncbi:hypothetical protein M595_0573 [Lyngbya aestuarii BL J]|uniref:Uncharacterized protein n=1 Tax=Lyngbya aestuarii BL J TaxID=1348334 RepID=U7QNU1_9CYAN|nr:hypothetical protein M595_0573 [Lyngbya aestuarii BL J]
MESEYSIDQVDSQLQERQNTTQTFSLAGFPLAIFVSV